MENTLHTVAHSVLLGITLVVLVLLLFLGRPSMAALVALTIPFALLVALLLMYVTGIPIGLLSVGAIDFGIIVNGAVIMAENIAHRLGGAARERTRQNVNKTVLAAALEVERPVFFSVLMIIGGLPAAALADEHRGAAVPADGPDAGLRLGGGLVLRAVRGAGAGHVPLPPRLPGMGEPAACAGSARSMRRSSAGCLHSRWLVAVAVAGLLAVVFVRVLPRLGTEFLPYMDEGVIWIRANFPEGTSIEQTARFGKSIREIILDFPEIQFVTVQSGRNDSGTDPFPPSRMEMMVGTETARELEAIPHQARIGRRPGRAASRGVSHHALQLHAADHRQRDGRHQRHLGEPGRGVLRPGLRRPPGTGPQDGGSAAQGSRRDGREHRAGGAAAAIADHARPGAVRRHNVRIDDVNRLINTALGGEPVGALYEGDRRFDIVAKLDRGVVTSAQAIGRLPVHTADGTPVPLAAGGHDRDGRRADDHRPRERSSAA